MAAAALDSDADRDLWDRVDGWIGRARLEAAAWGMLEAAEDRLKPEHGETSLQLLGFFVLDAVEQLAATASPEWTGEALRRLAAQASEGRLAGFTL